MCFRLKARDKGKTLKSIKELSKKQNNRKSLIGRRTANGSIIYKVTYVPRKEKNYVTRNSR